MCEEAAILAGYCRCRISLIAPGSRNNHELVDIHGELVDIADSHAASKGNR